MPAQVLHAPNTAGPRPPRSSTASPSGAVVAVDVGSHSLRVAVAGGARVEEPSVVAVGGDAVVAAGRRALDFADDPANGVSIVHPVCGGAPAHPGLFTELIQLVAARAGVTDVLGTVAVSMPSWLGAPEWGEMLACVRAALPAGDVIAVQSPVAAALGAEPVPPDGEPLIVLDVGHHLSEACVVIDGDAVEVRTEWTGGADATALLAAHLLESHAFDPDIDSLRRALRLATDPMYGRVSVLGTHAPTGRLDALTLPVAEVSCVLTPVFEQMADVVNETLAAAPNEIAAAASGRGVLITGGMSGVHGLRGHISHAVGAPVVSVESPARSVVEGLVRAAVNHAQH